LASNFLKRLIARDGWVAHIRELVLIVGAYFVYMIIRRYVIPDVEHVATANALKLIDFEKDLGFLWEPAWQDWALRVGPWLTTLFNWIYIVTFFPIVLTAAFLYYLMNREKYFYYRSVILLSFAVALTVFVLYPLSPPRYMPGFGFIDTISEYGPSWYGSREMRSYYNAYASMPSLHFAWTTIFGFIFFTEKAWYFKILGVLYPTMTLFAITITGNHYILDAVMGAVTMLVTYILYETIFRRRLYQRLIPSKLRLHWNFPLPQFRKQRKRRVSTP